MEKEILELWFTYDSKYEVYTYKISEEIDLTYSVIDWVSLHIWWLTKQIQGKVSLEDIKNLIRTWTLW